MTETKNLSDAIEALYSEARSRIGDVNRPNWHSVGSWTSHVPASLRECWASVPTDTRKIIAVMADKIVDLQNWS
jgi:hypothetical protein